MNVLTLGLLGKAKFRRILELARKTSAGYRPPSTRNDGRGASFANFLQDQQADVNELVDKQLERIVVCNATIVSDAATVHCRPVSDFMLKAVCHKLPMMLNLVDSTTVLQNGVSCDAEWCAAKTCELIGSTPNGGKHILLMVGDTVAEQLAMFELVEEALTWISAQLGICHGVNRILLIIGRISAVAKIIKEVLEVVDWFLNHKVQHTAFEKHSNRRSLVTPCDSRYGYNFIAMLKLLKEVKVAQKAMGDAAYCEANFEDDIIKFRVNEIGWWNRVADICQFVFPYLRVLRAADSNAPMLSKIHGRKLVLEKQLNSYLSGAVTTTGRGTAIDATVIGELIQPIFDAKDHLSQSGPSYWDNLTSEFALAAGVPDPEFHEGKPWLWPSAIDAVTAQFRKRYSSASIGEDTRKMLSDFDLFKDKRGKFSPAHLWP